MQSNFEMLLSQIDTILKFKMSKFPPKVIFPLTAISLDCCLFLTYNLTVSYSLYNQILMLQHKLQGLNKQKKQITLFKLKFKSSCRANFLPT